MIKLSVNKGLVKAEIVGKNEVVQGEIIATSIYLTQLMAQARGISFNAASLLIMQQSSLAFNQTMNDIQNLDGGDQK